MLKIINDNIYLTRGDSALIDLELDNYTPLDSDRITFTVKTATTSAKAIISKEIKNGMLKLESSDTAKLVYRNYVYDIQLTRTQLDSDEPWVETIIGPNKLVITEEVTF